MNSFRENLFRKEFLYMNEKDKKKKFIPPEPPESCDSMDFDMMSVASANECTGMGRIMPVFSEFDEDLDDEYYINLQSGRVGED